MKYEKAFDIIRDMCKGAKASVICSFLITPTLVKAALGRDFQYSNLILLTGEKSLDTQKSIYCKRILDSSSIPLMSRVFHSKIYLFEKPLGLIQVIIGSFNATSAGMNHNFEFWIKTQAKFNIEGFSANNIADLFLDKKVNVDAVSWKDFCLEEERLFIVAPAADVLWRLIQKGKGLAPSNNPRCLSDTVLSENEYKKYDSILVHSLGNNSLSKALELMIKDTIGASTHVNIRVVSPYHNIEGIEYLYRKCQEAIGKKFISVDVELLTVFPPDFSEKFSDPKKQPFASMEKITKLNSKDERIRVKLRLWKKETNVKLSELGCEVIEPDNRKIQNIFLHGKAIIAKSDETCSSLLGSPNLTSSAFGSGANVNFETAVWERNQESARAVWASLDPLFQVCEEVKKEDYEAFKVWSTLFSKDLNTEEIMVKGSRDAIRSYLKVSLKNGDSYQPFESFDETRVYFDELKTTKLSIKVEPGCPRIAKKVHITFCPSNLEETKEVDTVFDKGETSSELVVDAAKHDTYSISFDINSNLIEERQVKIQTNEKTIETATNLILFEQDSVQTFFLIETVDGWTEIECYFHGERLRATKPSNVITKAHAILRVYSKSESTPNSFGYYIIRCRKREPKFFSRINAIRPYPFSIYFEELENQLAAKILPESLNVKILTENSLEIPTNIAAVRKVSTYPFIASILFLPTHEFDSSEVRIEVSFVDEHGGSYHKVSNPLMTGYIEINGNKTVAYVPKNMAAGFLFGTLKKKENMICVASNNYNKLLLSSELSFVDGDKADIWLLCDPLPDLILKVRKAELKLSPKREFAVSNAPVMIRHSISEVVGIESNQVALLWTLRNFGQEERGGKIAQTLSATNQFEITSSDLHEIQTKLHDLTDQWKGYLDFYFSYLLAGQYYLRTTKNTVNLLSSEIFLNSIFKNFSTIKLKQKLLNDLTNILHSYFIINVPIHTFRKAICLDEGAIWSLRESYEYSPVIGGDGFGEFSIKSSNREKLLNDLANVIIDSIYYELIYNDDLPKIPEEVVFSNLCPNVLRQIESLLIIPGERGEIRVAPGRLFFSIAPDWIFFLRKIA